MGDQRDRQADDQQPGDAHPDQDGARDDAADVEQEDRGGRDRDQDRRVDDAFDHDRAERGGAAEPLAIAQVVAANQLAEAGRQHVVGEIAHQEVAQDRDERDASDRGQQDLPADGPAEDVETDAASHGQDPAGRRVRQHATHRRDVHLADHERERGQRDRDPDPAADQRPAHRPRRPGPRRRVTRAACVASASARAGCGPGGARTGARPAGWRDRRPRCAGTRPSSPPRSSGSGPRSRRS